MNSLAQIMIFIHNEESINLWLQSERRGWCGKTKGKQLLSLNNYRLIIPKKKKRVIHWNHLHPIIKKRTWIIEHHQIKLEPYFTGVWLVQVNFFQFSNHSRQMLNNGKSCMPNGCCKRQSKLITDDFVCLIGLKSPVITSSFFSKGTHLQKPAPTRLPFA